MEERIRNYEMMVLTDPNVDEAKLNVIFDKLADLGEKSGAKITNKVNWGKRKLAYEIKDLKEGVYYLLDLESDSLAIAKLESFLKIQTPILRFLTIRKLEKVKKAKKKVN